MKAEKNIINFFTFSCDNLIFARQKILLSQYYKNFKCCILTEKDKIYMIKFHIWVK